MIELDIKMRAEDEKTVEFFSQIIYKAFATANSLEEIDVTLSVEKDGGIVTVTRREIINTSKNG
jgi:hypothetical protein